MEIAVIVTHYNKGSLLSRALLSLQKQTDKVFKVVVLDDASTDPVSVEAFRKNQNDFASDGRFSFLMNSSNCGAAKAKNIAIDHAVADVVALLDADDTFPPSAIASIRVTFQANPSAGFVFGDYEKMSINTSRFVRLSHLTNEGRLDPRLLYKNWLLLGSSPIKKSVWESVGGYNELAPRTDDFEFFRKVLLAGHEGFYCKESIYQWYPAPGGNQSSCSALDTAFVFFRTFGFEYRFAPKFKLLQRLALNVCKLFMFPLLDLFYYRPAGKK